jgi:hypothetical protein
MKIFQMVAHGSRLDGPARFHSKRVFIAPPSQAERDAFKARCCEDDLCSLDPSLPCEVKVIELDLDGEWPL